jgi:hypothetical protein
MRAWLIALAACTPQARSSGTLAIAGKAQPFAYCSSALSRATLGGIDPGVLVGVAYRFRLDLERPIIGDAPETYAIHVVDVARGIDATIDSTSCRRFAFRHEIWLGTFSHRGLRFEGTLDLDCSLDASTSVAGRVDFTECGGD